MTAHDFAAKAGRDKAWAEFKPRPLRVNREIGEPPHGAAYTSGPSAAGPGIHVPNSGRRA